MVRADRCRDSGRAPGVAGKPHERFIALIAAEREPILTSYIATLEAWRSSLVADAGARARAKAEASDILSDVAASLCDSTGRPGQRHETLARMTDHGGTENQVSLADRLRAAAGLFDITVSTLSGHVSADPDLVPSFVIVVLALNEGIARRIREATLAYTGNLLERVGQAHVDERRRIARDLHDRLGEGMSAALRQLELHELAVEKDSLTSSPWTARARDALTEAMRRLRVVISNLRQDSIRSLETALVQYIDSVASDADVRLRVSGDETWAPSEVIEEAFLIVREAIRNAFQHAVPRQVLIGVALAPHELHAWVEDDGRGFVLSSGPGSGLGSGPGSGPGGAGLASMRERAELIGGRLTIASVPGHGTQVELLVPLPGSHDE